MLVDIIKQLQAAYKVQNKKDIKRLTRILNKSGMDCITINILLNSVK